MFEIAMVTVSVVCCVASVVMYMRSPDKAPQRPALTAARRRAFPDPDVLAKVPAFGSRKGVRKLKAAPDEMAALRAQVQQLDRKSVV